MSGRLQYRRPNPEAQIQDVLAWSLVDDKFTLFQRNFQEKYPLNS
jgi:hypothetical protein